MSETENVTIPDAAIEAAATATFEHEHRGAPAEWRHMGNGTLERYRASARVALEAAAPHMV